MTTANPPESHRHDALVVGGGPTGATAALLLARAGLDVALVERARFPRFHVGESLLPRNMPLLRELGLDAGLHEVPQIVKRGVEIAWGHEEEGRHFSFADGLLDAEATTINVERAPFDAHLLAAARAAGARVSEGAAARRILRLDDDGVEMAVADDAGRAERTVRARILLDASGQTTFVGKHLASRRVLPDLRKVAYFGHFRNVDRLPPGRDGDPTLVMMREGWFWSIPLDAERTSIGLVLDQEAARLAGVAPDRMLAWGIARCPFLRRRTAAAVFPATNGVAADFSYRCDPYAGPGYFLVGDAATFVDPIFSTGICLGMMGAVEAVAGVLAIRAGVDPRRVRRRYVRFVEDASRPFFRLVRQYYDPAFRDLLMEGQGPLAVHRAILTCPRRLRLPPAGVRPPLAAAVLRLPPRLPPPVPPGPTRAGPEPARDGGPRGGGRAARARAPEMMGEGSAAERDLGGIRDFTLLGVEASAGGWEIEVEVPAGARWFDGHFPGHPILPAVAQLALVDRLLRRLAGPGRTTGLDRFRLPLPVAPGDRLAVALARPDGGGRVPFNLRRGGAVVSGGTLGWTSLGTAPAAGASPDAAVAEAAVAGGATDDATEEVAGLLPHRGPALLARRIVERDAGGLVCAGTIPAASPLAVVRLRGWRGWRPGLRCRP